MAESLTLTWRQYRLERRMFWRNPTAAFFNFLFPIVLLALFGAIFNDNQHDLNVIVPGIAGMSVMAATFQGLAHNVLALREEGVLKRLRGTPMPTGSYLSALGLNAITNTIVQVGLVIVIGKAFFGTHWPLHWGELVVFVAAGAICFGALGVALSHAIPNLDAAPAYINAIFLPVLFISGVFYDVDTVPQALRDVAEALPLKHIIDGLSGALVTGKGLGDTASSLAVIGLWAVIGIALAVRGFSWEARRS